MPEDDIPNALETAAQKWLVSTDGRAYVDCEDLHEWGVDYVNALMNVPAEVFAEHGIYLGIDINGIVNLDPDVNLLPVEIREEV